MATKTQKRKDLKRAHAILEIFADAARLAQEGPSLLHAPPWRERYPDGELSYWYGPTSQTELEAEMAHYMESVHAGGHWDHDEDSRVRVKKERLIKGREDAASIKRYVDRFSAFIPERELDVYMLYFVQQRTFKVIATELGISRRTVEGYVNRLRKRVKDHTTGIPTSLKVRTRSPKNGRFARSSMDMVAPD